MTVSRILLSCPMNRRQAHVGVGFLPEFPHADSTQDVSLAGEKTRVWWMRNMVARGEAGRHLHLLRRRTPSRPSVAHSLESRRPATSSAQQRIPANWVFPAARRHIDRASHQHYLGTFAVDGHGPCAQPCALAAPSSQLGLPSLPRPQHRTQTLHLILVSHHLLALLAGRCAVRRCRLG